MIELGLGRISRLLQLAPPPTWRAIHVAGTNGKGSVCAYLSALLHARGVSCGRFTSPHMVDRWDCVVVDERAVDKAAFLDAEQAVRRRDRDAAIGATEFELLAATAFELFQRSRVAVAVIEAGLGGALDATTAMTADRVATVIARIGLDHQTMLGTTTAAIAAHKAGIMRPGVPCVVNIANRDGDSSGTSDSVRPVLEAHARTTTASLLWADPLSVLPPGVTDALALEPHQLSNLACAYAAFRIAIQADHDADFLTSVVRQVSWPGRLQRLDIAPLLSTGLSAPPALLDGAHNAQSAEVLAAYVDRHLRPGHRVTWLIAASRGKDLDSMLRLLLRPGDRVAALVFGPVDGMPWVRPADPQSILNCAASLGVAPEDRFLSGSSGLTASLQWAVSGNRDSTDPVVIAGSLYLVSDTLRLLRQASGKTGL
ncbi:dihydrofolate synthetase fol3 [Grosmannia clavigera kw1407]|uniref:Dihydrofolate synthetase fol3 n=1 Tax=Grosmannia clavigera (strain kw1407 / UAMH 11150) TaxID=655863 RepID=F0XLN3_GROCL|nr:dihydrofolate synthetase fol3 [Grosmannia clavigera kw1407]EFX01346.1 dihydrofolate synthetase fol3 [Grosmannia clavigera kw1407]